MPLHDALFVETNPAPVKYAASRPRPAWRDECACRWCRSPRHDEAAVRSAMVHAGLINA